MTHFLQRTALIALASGAVGAYTTPSAAQLFKPNFPIHMPEASAAEAPAVAPASASAAAEAAAPASAEGPVATAPRAAPVGSRALAPLPAAAVLTPAAYVQSDDADAAPVRSRHRRAKPAAPSAPPAGRSVAGKVVEIDGPPEDYTVKRGDTLEKIAKKLDTTVDALKADNHLRHDAVKPGQVLKGPRMASNAYVANAGDTLFSIARRFSVTPDDLRRENKLSARASIHPGQKIKLPQDYTDRGPLNGGARTAEAAEPDAAPPESAPPERSHRRGRAEAPAATRASDDQEVAESGGRMTNRSVTGRVVEVEGPPERYTVKRGDTLEKIAKKLDTTVDALKEDNRLRHDAVKPGQVLKGPRMASNAYVANAGDTLFSIAKRFGVTAEALRTENRLSRNAAIHAGEKIKLPENYTDHGPLTARKRVETPPMRPQPGYRPSIAAPPSALTEPATPSPSSMEPDTAPPATPQPATPPPSTTAPSAAPAAPQPYKPTPPRSYVPRPYIPPATTAGVPSAPSVSDSQISELGRGRFVWPLQGPIVSDYGPKTAGQRNDGINIGATVGASVHSAAAGDVVYAGDQVPGFGNLVLIKHPDGWVTAYGHLSRVEVKMQQHVAQGEEIGLAGATGGVSTPQVHFEIRYAPTAMERAKPVDPKLVLPQE